MNQFFARNRLSEYLDGTLSEEEHREVQQSLENDPALYAEYLDLKEAVDMLNNFGMISPPRDLTSTIMDQLEQEEQVKEKVVHLSFTRFAPLVAIAAAIVLVVIGGMSPEKTSDQTMAAGITNTPPQSRPIQLPKNLSETLFTQQTITKPEIQKSTPEPTKPILTQKTKSVQQPPQAKKQDIRIEPLVVDQPISRTENPYLLYMNDPEILFKLKTLAEENNSILSQRDGTAFTPYKMNGGKATQVVTLTANPDKIEGIEATLRQLGAEFHQFSSVTEQSPIKIEISIQLE